jgi:L,D-transpeptidase ErfK/SrfK
MKLQLSFLFCLSLFFHEAFSLKFPLPETGNDLVGELQVVTAQKGDTLSSLGMHYNIGYYEMTEANQGLPKVGRLKPGTEVLIPSRFILPSVRKGLVINLAELRVYFFPKDEASVYTFPIGAGREGWNTPQMTTRIRDKKKDPTWIVPDSIMAESLSQGKALKKFYPPGPENPLGKYALYFDAPGIRIHGTNISASVGKRVSHGCIRLLPDDIESLYENVPIGTKVTITHEQNKAGWDNHTLYLESEVPFSEYHDSESALQAINRATKNHPATIDWARAEATQQDEDGVPTAIGYDEHLTSLPPDEGEDELPSPENIG